MENLGKVKVGVFYTIKGFSDKAPLKIKRRLLELGLTVGQSVRLVRKSLLGKAFLLQVRGYTLSLRRSLASFVMLEGRGV